jgi:hypothetical protein
MYGQAALAMPTRLARERARIMSQNLLSMQTDERRKRDSTREGKRGRGKGNVGELIEWKKLTN